LKSDTRHWGIDCKDTPRFETIRYDSEINSLNDTFFEEALSLIQFTGVTGVQFSIKASKMFVAYNGI